MVRSRSGRGAGRALPALVVAIGSLVVGACAGQTVVEPGQGGNAGTSTSSQPTGTVAGCGELVGQLEGGLSSVQGGLDLGQLPYPHDGAGPYRITVRFEEQGDSCRAFVSQAHWPAVEYAVAIGPTTAVLSPSGGVGSHAEHTAADGIGCSSLQITELSVDRAASDGGRAALVVVERGDWYDDSGAKYPFTAQTVLAADAEAPIARATAPHDFGPCSGIGVGRPLTPWHGVQVSLSEEVADRPELLVARAVDEAEVDVDWASTVVFHAASVSDGPAVTITPIGPIDASGQWLRGSLRDWDATRGQQLRVSGPAVDWSGHSSSLSLTFDVVEIGEALQAHELDQSLTVGSFGASADIVVSSDASFARIECSCEEACGFVGQLDSSDATEAVLVGRGLGPSGLFVVDGAGQPLAELGFVALADGWFEARYATEGSPRVGFELVHSASYCLWGDGLDVVELDRAAAE